MFRSEEFIYWNKRWKDRLNKENTDKKTIQKRMENANPAVIPRNNLVEEALEYC